MNERRLFAKLRLSDRNSTSPPGSEIAVAGPDRGSDQRTDERDWDGHDGADGRRYCSALGNRILEHDSTSFLEGVL
jgi:hypothetical protein